MLAGEGGGADGGGSRVLSLKVPRMRKMLLTQRGRKSEFSLATLSFRSCTSLQLGEILGVSQGKKKSEQNGKINIIMGIKGMLI